MMRLHKNKIWLFVLITAFLTMQWSTAHIHFSEIHDHNGSHHEHYSEVHAHHSIDHHASILDVTHQTSNIDVVELDHKFNATRANKREKSPASTITSTFYQVSLSQISSIEPPQVVNIRLNCHYLTIVNPRAPPRFS